MKIEIQMICLAMVSIITIDLVVDVVVSIASQVVVMVVPHDDPYGCGLYGSSSSELGR